MSDFLWSINTVAGLVLTAVVNQLGLACALAATAWLVLRLWGRAGTINSATRHAIWWMVLAAVLALPFAPRLDKIWRSGQHSISQVPDLPILSPQRASAPGVKATAVTVQPERVGTWPLYLSGLWAAIFLFRIGQLLRSYAFLRGVKSRASIAFLPLPDRGIKRKALLLLSGEISSPMAVGFMRPAIILPERILDQLDEPEAHHVLLHELAHIARYDDWTNLAARMIAGAVALHPVAIWVLRQIEREREMACDDFVVAQTGEARPYAKSLARLFEMRWAGGGGALASGIFGSRSKLGDRIEMLLRGGRDFSTHAPLKRVLLAALVLLGLVLASAGAPRWIVFAQSSGKPKFEVASVKPSSASADSRNADLQSLPGGKLVIRNIPFRIIVAWAYNVPFQSPRLAVAKEVGKLDFDRYDIDAVAEKDAVPPGTSSRAREEKMRLMLQSLLEERFKLKMKIDPQEQPVYVLTVAKGGPKLQKSAIQEKDCADAPSGPGGKCHDIRGGIGRGLHSEAITIEEIALLVQNWSDRPVLDKTGLHDLYNIQTEGWAPMRPIPPRPDGGPPTGGDVGLQDPLRQTMGDMFAKLGLKMDSQRAVVDMFIIEHVEKPAAN